MFFSIWVSKAILYSCLVQLYNGNTRFLPVFKGSQIFGCLQKNILFLKITYEIIVIIVCKKCWSEIKGVYFFEKTRGLLKIGIG